MWKQGNFKNPNFATVWGVQANIQKSQFSFPSTNWEKLRIPVSATFKNPTFQSLCELGKTGKYIQPNNFESIDELAKSMP